jgi:hypothetical protein
MKAAGLLGKVLLVLGVSATLSHASDPMAVYARVDKVVLEPNGDAPQTIQIWGVFAVARPDDRNEYLAPVRGSESRFSSPRRDSFRGRFAAGGS